MIDLPESPPDVSRVRILFAIFAIGLFVILARLWYLQVAHGDELLEASISNQRRKVRQLPPRGLIEDRNGKVLAENRQQTVVAVDPQQIKQNPEVLPILARMLNVPLNDLEEDIRKKSGKSEFDWVTVKEDVGIDVVTQIEEQGQSLPGVIVFKEPIRSYPDGPLFAHVIGQMGQARQEDIKKLLGDEYRPGDRCGKLGIEAQYETMLRGKNGGKEIEVDARGRYRGDMTSSAPQPGDRIMLSVDTELQKVAVEELTKWVKNGHPGAAVAMDVETGEVLAMASCPSFDPNLFVKGISAKDWKMLQNDPLKPQINRAAGMRLAPGSTFKVVTAAAGLETNTCETGSREFCNGSIQLGKWIKRCYKSSGHGSMNLIEALAQSCDVYFYRLGQKLGPESIAEYARKFGLGSKTGIDLPLVEDAGVVPDAAWKKKHNRGPWVGGDTVDFAIGQASLACTPLQMCRLTAAIANGGTLLKPQLVKKISRIDDDDKLTVVHELKPEPNGNLGLKSSTLEGVVRGMRAVMEPHGTAFYCNVPGITMAGKTGTAQVKMRNGELANNSWFIGYAPAEKPKIAICVFVEHGGHGGDTAGPIARKILAKYFKVDVTPPPAARGAND